MTHPPSDEVEWIATLSCDAAIQMKSSGGKTVNPRQNTIKAKTWFDARALAARELRAQELNDVIVELK